jgi:hypothetical protein
MATKHGQFMVFTTGAPKEDFDIINTEDYKLRLRKTWVEASNNWHIQLFSQSVLDTRWECFLTPEELKKLKDAL